MGFRALARLLAGLAILPASLGADQGKAEPEPPYDPATVVDVMATVLEVREVPRGNPLSGVHLTVRVEPVIVDVYLGPVDFLKDFELVFRRGDRIQVVGSKVKSGTAQVLLAREVRRSETTLYLRNRKGQPNWKP